MRHALVTAMTLAAASAPGAQPLTPGARARVGDAGGVRVAGRLAGVRPVGPRPAVGDTLFVRRCRDCADTALVLGPATSLERGRGRRGRPLAGLALGAAAGAGYVAVAVGRCQDGGEGPPCALGYTVLPLAAALGAIVGGAAGLFLPVGPERWEPVAVAARRAP